MKNSIQLAIGLMFMATVAFGFDTSDPEKSGMKVVPQQNGIYQLIYSTPEATTLEVRIMNDQGQTIHKEVMKSSQSFTRSYNLKNYGSGEYVFQAKDKNGSTEQVITHDLSSGIRLYEMLNMDKVKLIVSEPGLELTVKIYDNFGKLIDQDKVQSGEKGVGKVYDLSKRRVGDTTIKVLNGFEVVESLTI